MPPLGSLQVEKAKIEQIVSEFFAKVAHIILEARIPHLLAQAPGHGSNSGEEDPMLLLRGLPPSGAARATNKWFNLETESSKHVQESVEAWRRGLCHEAMVVDILVQQPASAAASPPSVDTNSRFLRGNPPPQWAAYSSGGPRNDGNEGESFSPVSRTLLERWVVHYERRKQPAGSGGLGFGAGMGKEAAASSDESFARFGRQQGGLPAAQPPPNHALERPVVYKRTVIMLRALYCSVRTLPAHHLFKLANSSSHSASFSLSYTVAAASAVAPAEQEHAYGAMMHSHLTPVETPWGRLCISVMYRNATAVTALEVTPPILPRIIADYVGSPTTDSVRRLTSVGSMPAWASPGRRETHVVSLPGSVPSSPSSGFGRRHSWSGGSHKVQSQPPTLPHSPSHRPLSPSPDFQYASPLRFHRPSSPSPSRGSAPRNPSPRSSPLHRHSSQPPSQPIPIHGRRSAPFASASPSPSPPQHTGGAQPSHQLRPSSAPVSIPWNPNPNPKPLASTQAAPEVRRQSRSPRPPIASQGRPSEMLQRALSFNSRLNPGSAKLSTVGGRATAQLSISALADSSLLASPPHPFHTEDKGHNGCPSGMKRSLYGSPGRTLGGFSRDGSDVRDYPVEANLKFPFIIDDDGADDVRNRMESLGAARPRAGDGSDTPGTTPGGSVQDAAAGALVWILQFAPPLRQHSAPPRVFADLARAHAEHPTAAQGAQHAPRGRPGEPSPATGLGAGWPLEPPPELGVRQAGVKTAANALEELKGYREMRDFLARQSGGDPL